MSGEVDSAIAPVVAIDGQAIHIATMGDLVDRTMARLEDGLGFTLYTLNLDHLVKRRMDEAFSEVYERATFVTADGAPLVWMARRQGVSLGRTTGADMLDPLCAAAADAGLPVALFGSSMKSLRRAAIELQRRYPRLEVAHLESPPQGFDPRSDAARQAGERIADSGARLCFIALGAPKQEFFSDAMAHDHPHIGYLGIGAALDFISGEQTRAPLFLQNHGLEWAWRLAQNPMRLASRYLRCAAVLADLVVLEPLRRRLMGATPPRSVRS